MKTKSKKHGSSTLEAEVSHISLHGLWVLVGEQEFHLSFEDYPVFRTATVQQIQALKLLHGRHLRWEVLDADVDLDALKSPAAYPLVYR